MSCELLYKDLQSTWKTFADEEQPSNKEIQNIIMSLVEQFNQLGRQPETNHPIDEETLGLFARVYKEIWKSSGKNQPQVSQSLPIHLFQFMTKIAESVKSFQPEIINTWGDALFVVMSKAKPLLEYAFAIQEKICMTDWQALGLLKQMNIRIALHAGAVRF
jgi:hypothetical protein